MTEHDNERRIVTWLGAIACLAICAAAVLVVTSTRTKFGIDTAVVVAFVGIAGTCVSSLGTRRTRTDPPPDPGTPPPYPPPGV